MCVVGVLRPEGYGPPTPYSLQGEGASAIIGYMDNREAQEHSPNQSKERREDDERVVA